jgi:hypothetical protein
MKRRMTPEEKARQARIQAAHEEAAKALRDNRCPICGETVRINSSLSGWVQCSQFGAPQFRKDPNRPSCNWQGFTH